MTGLKPLVSEDTGPNDQMLGVETTGRGGAAVWGNVLHGNAVLGYMLVS